MNSFQMTDEQHASAYLAGQLGDAAKLHRTLIPRAVPQMKGFRFTQLYHPCRSLGGDFYDFCAVSGGLVIIVGNISGRGHEAALATMLVKYVFREAAARCDGLLQVLSEMNTRLYEALPGGMFVSASLVGIRGDDPCLCVAAAGLPSPIRVCAGTGAWEQIESSGTPLGLLSDPQLTGYGEQVVEMNVGDVLIVASDDLSAGTGSAGRFLGGQQVLGALRKNSGKDRNAIVQSLVDGAISFSDGQLFPDDIRILSITRQ